MYRMTLRHPSAAAERSACELLAQAARDPALVRRTVPARAAGRRLHAQEGLPDITPLLQRPRPARRRLPSPLVWLIAGLTGLGVGAAATAGFVCAQDSGQVMGRAAGTSAPDAGTGAAAPPALPAAI